MKYLEFETKNYLEIMNNYKVSSLLAKVVSSFGYSEAETASFFSPKIGTYLDCQCLKQLGSYIDLILKNNYKVFVFGDYDCDGICATTIMIKTLRKLKIQAGYYIPDRYNEGYGLNNERIKQAADKGYKVLITVDNGVSCQKQLEYAHSLGLITIVTDHHIINEEVNCDCLVHPTLMGADYQYLCGAGVCYCIAHYLHTLDDSIRELAMIATIGDVMELKGVNVPIVIDGLNILRNHRYRNIDALANFSSLSDETDVGFTIVPRLNAIGRMLDNVQFDPKKRINRVFDIVTYLLYDDEMTIKMTANEIGAINELRKNTTTEQFALVNNLVEKDAMFNCIVCDDLCEGVVGAIAGKVVESTKKPTLILTNTHDSDIYKGSARSIPGVDVMKVVEGFRSQSEALGGHAGAFGIAVKKDKLEALKQYLKDNYHGSEESISYYINVSNAEITLTNLQQLFSYRPFGQGRKLPLMKVTFSGNGNVRKLNNNFNLKWNPIDRVPFEVICFGAEMSYENYLSANEVSFIGTLGINNFNGRTTYQLRAEKVYVK